jgi:putative glutamine amidotransferase
MWQIINLFILLFITFSTFAVEPFIWQQNKHSAPIIMPLKDGQTKKDAIKEYFGKLHSKKSVSSLLKQSEIQNFTKDETLTFEEGTFKNFDSNETSKPRFVVVTNELRELYAPPSGRRVANVIKRLEALGAEVLVLPVMHDLNLNAIEAKEYRRKLSSYFDAQLVLGGADIDPYLYGEEITFARDVNRRRDVSELKFVRSFITSKRGMSFGICRGHQMCAVAHHKKLVQDIQIEEGASDIHLNGDHDINVNKESEVFSVFDENKLLVNSLHHQAVIVPDGDKDYKIIASSTDNIPIVEAIEFKNGLGVTLQFHPELMHNETGEKILKQFIKLTQKNIRLRNSKRTCSDLLRGLVH